MNNFEITERINKLKLISVLRNIPDNKILKVTQSLLEGGINVVEIPFGNDNTKGQISLLKKEFKKHLICGAGTVLSDENFKDACLSGADFMLSPNLNDKLVAESIKQNKLFIPGVFTPTEIVNAYNIGAKIIKIFPVTSIGASYIKDILVPLPFCKFIPMGGITLKNANEFIKAGSFALGIGSSLARSDLIESENYSEITNLAKHFCEAVQL